MSTDPDRIHAESAHNRFERNTAAIVARLRDIADQAERDAVVRPVTHGAPPHSWAAQQVQHSVLWGVANLSLDGLTNAAAEADEAAARIPPPVTADRVAQLAEAIRRLDGNHDLGAAELAAALLDDGAVQ